MRPAACERCGAPLAWVGAVSPRRCDAEVLRILPGPGDVFFAARGPVRGAVSPDGTVEARRLHACVRTEERKVGLAQKAVRKIRVEASIAAMRDPEAAQAGQQIATLVRMKRYVRAIQKARLLAQDVLRDVGDDVSADLRRRLEALSTFALDPKDEGG